MSNKCNSLDGEVEVLLAAVRASDADGIAAVLDRLDRQHGPAAAVPMTNALEANHLTDAMVGLLQQRAEKLRTATAWIQAANAAVIMGRNELATGAASAALELDPAMPSAVFFLSVAANRCGDYALALRAIADLAGRNPVAKEDPHLLLQIATAELGRKQPQAALAILEPALARFAAAGLGFDAHALRARAISGIPERVSQAAEAWERALAVAQGPMQTDHARDGLIAALNQDKRFDECLRRLDEAIPATTNAAARSVWQEARLHLLMVKGNSDAYAVIDARIAAEKDPAKRLQLRLVQARTAVAGERWKEAGTRFDAALAEIPGDSAEAAQQRLYVHGIKVVELANHDINSVLADLDLLDATWEAPGWPLTIDQRMSGLLAAGRGEEALAWLERRLAQSPALASHPAAYQCRGDVELKLGRGQAARQSYTQSLEATHGVADQRAYGAKLMSAFGTQRWKEVGEFRDRLVALNPALSEDPKLRTIAAQAALRRDDAGATITLTAAPLPVERHFRDLRDLTRGEALLRLGRFDEALALANEAIQRCQRTGPADPATRALLITVHALRAQAFNARQDFQSALDAATKAIETPDPGGDVLDGQTVMVRIGAFMQRSLAQFRLGNKDAANQDVDAAINAFQELRQTAIFELLENGLEFGRLEASLWYGKGVVLHSESRSEEALAAYSRAERLETKGSAAAIGMGYALSATGSYEKALIVFERALTRASSVQERFEALAGKGRALVRLRRFEDAIDALQAALDARLTEPDNDPDVFELLGIAYDTLKRNGAALRAFRRVWALTPKDKRSANLARGVTAAELRLGNPSAALEFLDGLPERLKDERTLLLNRALALDALGRRAEAIACLVRARDAGLDSARRELHRLDAPAGLGRWTHFWFGAQARQRRRAGGTILLLIAATGLAAPLFQWWLEGKLDWYLLLLPSAVALALLALPNMKAISAEAGPFKLEAEPQTATGGEAAAPAAPESFSVPTFGSVAVAVTEAKATAVWTGKPSSQ